MSAYFKESEIHSCGYRPTGNESNNPPSNKDFVESSGHFPHAPDAFSIIKWFRLESRIWKEYRLIDFGTPKKYPDNFPTQYMFPLTPQTSLTEATDIINYWSTISRVAHLVDYDRVTIETIRITEEIAEEHFPQLYNSSRWWKK